MDWGLLGAAAEGVNQGLVSYNDARDRKLKREQEAQGLQLQKNRYMLDMSEKGMELNPTTGKIEPTEQKRLKEEQERNLREREMQVKEAELKLKPQMGLLESKLKQTQLAKAQQDLDVGKLPTQGALNAKQYSDRMKEGEKILANVKDFDPTSLRTPENLTPEYFKSQGRKGYDTAVKTFAMGLLRKESGAAISPQEFASVEKAYFPQPGDGPDVLAQKANLRAGEIANIEREASPAIAYQQKRGLLDGSVSQATPAKPEKRLVDAKSDAEELAALKALQKSKVAR